MTQTRRALVLGGGGPVGVAWELGLAAGLASAGVDLAQADTVVGTSAGSITGAYLAGGADPTQLVDEVGDLFSRNVADSGVDQVSETAVGDFLDQLIGAITDTDRGTPEQRFAEIGQLALAATTISEDAFVGALASALGDLPWSDRFSCTAVNVATGAFTVWDAAAGVPLERAVASSCAVPGIYPPITINGERYMDGGVRSPLNADLGAGHDIVLVVSVMPLELPPELADARFQPFFDAMQAEIDGLRSASQVEVIAPDDEFLELSGYGLSLMDFTLIPKAATAGVRLGTATAARVGARWGGA